MLCPPRENPRLCEGVAFSDIASQSQVKPRVVFAFSDIVSQSQMKPRVVFGRGRLLKATPLHNPTSSWGYAAGKDAD